MLLLVVVVLVGVVGVLVVLAKQSMDQAEAEKVVGVRCFPQLGRLIALFDALRPPS